MILGVLIGIALSVAIGLLYNVWSQEAKIVLTSDSLNDRTQIRGFQPGDVVIKVCNRYVKIARIRFYPAIKEPNDDTEPELIETGVLP